MTCPSQIWKHSRQGNAFGTSIHSRAFNETLSGYDQESIFGRCFNSPKYSQYPPKPRGLLNEKWFCISITLLLVTPVSLLESCDTQRRRSSSFSTNTQISRACFQIGKLGKIKCLINLLKNSPKLSIKARAAVSFRYRNAFLIFTFEPIPSDKYHSTFFFDNYK